MYAIVESGGKQYKATPGATIDVERLDAEVGQAVELDRVLVVAGDGHVQVGHPLLEYAKVLATVVTL